MTIDERLDRLTDRHEALTQSVELLLIAQKHTEEAQAKTQILLANVVESIGRLERIAFAHEGRISKLEGGRV